jgi:hypothetical protein
LPIVLAIAVTVIVAGVALTQLHGGRQSPPAASPTSGAGPRQQLIDMLGILRRPQTKADLDSQLLPGVLQLSAIATQRHRHQPGGLEHRLAQLGNLKLDRPLMRVVAIPAWHAKVGIEPETWQPSPTSRLRSEGVDLELWIGSRPTIPPSSNSGTGPPPTSVEAFRTHGLALADKPNGHDRLYGAVLVPDGVARITLHPIRLNRVPVNIDPRQFGTATATVHDNIASFQLPIPTATSPRSLSGELATSAVAQATWLAANGTVIRRTTTELNVVIRIVSPKRP